jgi:hypothetical protein
METGYPNLRPARPARLTLGRLKYIATVTPADGDRYIEALAFAIAQGAVAPDAPQPAAFGLVNGIWEVQA